PSGVHLVDDVAELLERTGERNELVQHELPRLIEVHHQWNVMVRAGRTVAATEQPAVDVGQGVDVHRDLGSPGRDADGNGIATPVEAIQSTTQYRGMPDTVEG